MDFSELYNRYYIKTDAQTRIIDGWSDGPLPEKDVEGTVCINEKGSYQFRLFPGGEENPPLYTMDGIPLYKWDGQAVQPRTEAELAADRAALPSAPPSAEQQQFAALALKQAQQDTAIAQLQQANAALMLQLAQTQAKGGEVDA